MDFEQLLFLGILISNRSKDVKRLVISDTHIGSKFSRKEMLYELLMEKEYDQLILNGDIIELLKVPTFSKIALEIFKVAKNKAKEVIYIIGNHDIAMAKFVDQNFLKILNLFPNTALKKVVESFE